MKMKRIAASAAVTFMMAGAASAAPLFYGYESYNTSEKLGWYSVEADGSTSYLWTNDAAKEGIPMQHGWLRNGKLCGISSLLADGRLYALDYVEINQETGETELTKPIEIYSGNYINYYLTATYVPGTDRVYGYGYSADTAYYIFKSSSYDMTDTQEIRVVSDYEVCSSLVYNPDTGQLVGFNRTAFVTVDPATGIQTEVFTPSNIDFSYTITGIGYDPASGLYYWNMVSKDQKSHMYEVDLNRKTCKLVCDYPDLQIFSFLLPSNPDGDPEAPAAPEFEASGFTGGALSGTVSFRLPSELMNGDKIESTLKWTAFIDGVEVESGEGSPATTVTFETGTLKEGVHLFGVRASLGDKTSRLGQWNGYVGLDTPSAPTNVDLKGTALTWEAVTTGAHGGYVDPEAISYTVYLNGKLQGTTEETSYTVTYPEGQTYAPYKATVTASFNGKTSEAGASETVRTGDPLKLPIDLTPSTVQSQLFESKGVSSPEAVWTYDNSESGRENFTSPASEGNAIDSWLFMPPVALTDADGVYEVSIRAALANTSLADGTFEVMVGTAPTPEAMTTTVMTPVTLTKTSLREFKGLFSPAALGGAKEAYVGIRALSQSGNYRVSARRFIVKTTNMKATVADAPVVESVTAGEEGLLHADVNFVFPTKLMNGEAIPADAKLKAVIQCDMAKTTVEGRPGEKASGRVETLQGENYVTVTSVLNDVNGNYGRIRVYTGMAVPSGVTNLRYVVADDNQSCRVDWDAPTEGVGEGFIDPDFVSYYYCALSDGEYKPTVNLGRDKNYTIEAPVSSRLSNVNFAIQARTDAGASTDLVGASIQLGKPYTLPMTEIFYDVRTERPTMKYSPYTMLTTGEYVNTAWQIADPAEIGPEYKREIPIALIGSGRAGSLGYFQLPKFSTKDCTSAGIELSVYGDDTTPAVTVWGYSARQSEPVKIGEISDYRKGVYHTYGIQLPESLQNQGWVTVYLLPDYQVDGYFVLSDYNIESTIGIDLPSADANTIGVRAGKGTLTITGETAAEVYTLDGRKVWSGEVNGEQTLRLNPALYLVTTSAGTVKTNVR